MQTTVATNAFYEIKVDQAKNRLFLKVIGFWKEKAQCSTYEAELMSAVRSLSKGFTIVTDAREMKAPTQEVGMWIGEIQGKLLAAGLSRTAEIHASAVFKMTAARFARESEMKVQAFEKIEDGEKWLDT